MGESIAVVLEQMIENLAAIEHERWAHWQKYMHGKCKVRNDGSLLIPVDLVRHWERQISTPYTALPEAEKESDRDQVRRYLSVIIEALSDAGV